MTRSLILHLLPGVLILAAVFIVTPLTIRYGLPDMLVGVVVIGLVLIPLELGYLLYRGRVRQGKLSLREVVQYRSSMPTWQYIASTVPIAVWVLFVFGVVAPRSTTI